MESVMENDAGEWGWEPIDSEEDVAQANADNKKESPRSTESNTKIAIKNTSSDNFTTNKFLNHSLKKGITSSPSFQELEKAIGATILNGSTDDLGASHQNLNALAQQKAQQQRYRQKMQYPPPYSNSPQSPAAFSSDNTKAELSQFIGEKESRALILFHSPLVSTISIRDICQKYGVLYYIRPEFHSKGVTFLCYFDLRSAMRAKATLDTELGADAYASVHYSIQLHASSNCSEEFRLLVRNISTSLAVDEQEIQALFSRYGPIRTFERLGSSNIEGESDNNVSVNSANNNSNGNSENNSILEDSSQQKTVAFNVEFYNIQDARLAASELSASSNNIWGTHASIAFASLDDRIQLLCKNLLNTLSKWRNELTSATYNSTAAATVSGASHQFLNPPVYYNTGYNNTYAVNGTENVVLQTPYVASPIQMPMIYSYAANPYTQASYNNMSLGPQNYLKVQSNYASYTKSKGYSEYPQHYTDLSNNKFALSSDYQNQKINSQLYATMSNLTISNPASAANNNANPAGANMNDYNKNGPIPFKNIAYPTSAAQSSYTLSGPPQPLYQVPVADVRPHHHNGGHGHGSRHNSNNAPPGANNRPPLTRTLNPAINSPGLMNVGGGDSYDPEFALDLHNLLDGSDTRTTVMVRNIPNKYNQQMLLEEVNINHEGKYDFFYLPIDFKNRCNVGYCFINFLEPQFIVAFVNEFNGQRWKSFNSEKVCIVSFARIQGKAAMVSRFQNSSLLEKDDEYQPLLFYSSGPERGKLEPFPSNRHRVLNQQQQQQQHMQQQSNRMSSGPMNGSNMHMMMQHNLHVMNEGTSSLNHGNFPDIDNSN